MNGFRNFVRIGLFSVVALVLVACSEQLETHGYAPTEGDLAEIEVGVDTRDTVEAILGEPSIVGMLNDAGWFYVKSEFRHFAFKRPEEIGRTVVAILYDEDGLVANVERFGVEDGQIVALSRRVTSTNTTGVGFLQQLMGSLGNFNPGGILGSGE